MNPTEEKLPLLMKHAQFSLRYDHQHLFMNLYFFNCILAILVHNSLGGLGLWQNICCADMNYFIANGRDQ